MKKKMLLPVILLVLALALAACGNDSADFPPHGVWDGNVYTNEYLGFTFTMPDDWIAFTDAGRPDTTVMESMQVSSLSGANVSIVYERLQNTGISAVQFIELSSAQTGAEVNLFPGTTRIGNYDWTSFETSMEIAFGPNIYFRQFVSIHEGFARTITILYDEGSESPEEILAMFSGIR